MYGTTQLNERDWSSSWVPLAWRKKEEKEEKEEEEGRRQGKKDFATIIFRWTLYRLVSV